MPMRGSRASRPSARKTLKGVLAVLTGADLKADGVKPIPPDASTTMPIEAQRRLPDVVLVHRDGPLMQTPYYPLAVDKVRYVGEGVVLVVAETLAIAKDAAELVEIDYEALAPTTDTAQAAEAAAPRVWDEARSNIFIDAEVGDAAATDRAFADAAHVVKLETWVQRVTGVPMEARTARRQLRQAERTLFSSRRQRRRRAPEGRACNDARGQARGCARGRLRHRRQFRDQELDLCRSFRWCCGLRSGSAAR